MTGSIQARHELVHERRNDEVWPGDPCARPGQMLLKGRRNMQKQFSVIQCRRQSVDNSGTLTSGTGIPVVKPELSLDFS